MVSAKFRQSQLTWEPSSANGSVFAQGRALAVAADIWIANTGSDAPAHAERPREYLSRPDILSRRAQIGREEVADADRTSQFESMPPARW
jgi:hypothetical protein